jgi:hypothetical protein
LAQKQLELNIGHTSKDMRVSEYTTSGDSLILLIIFIAAEFNTSRSAEHALVLR